MRIFRPVFLTLAGAIFLAPAGPARAAGDLTRLLFSGTVTHVSQPSVPLLNSSVAVGSAFTVELAFDPSVPDARPEPTFGMYFQTAPGNGMTARVGSYVFATDPAVSDSRLDVQDNGTSEDSIHVYSGAAQANDSGLTVDGIRLRFFDRTKSALSSDALAVGPLLDLSRWTFFTDFDVHGYGGNISRAFTIYGAITGVQVVSPSAVPEFGAASAMAGFLGLGGLCALRGRRRGPRSLPPSV